MIKKYKVITLDKIEKYSELKSYQKMYQKMAVDLRSRKPSPEALLRRIAQDKGLYQVNTAVDAYNLVVMKNRVSLGAFDADQFEFPCKVSVAEGGEQIKLLGVDGVTTLKKGEVAYFDQKGPFNLDYNYRDADRTKVTKKTTRLFINVDGVFEVTEDMVRKSLSESIEIITKYCGGKVVESGIVSAKDGVKPIKGVVVKSEKYDYKERKIAAILSKDLSAGMASNALGHLVFAAGHRADDSWMGRENYIDANGQKHAGISRYPVVTLGAETKKIKQIVNEAKEMPNVAVADYPQEMFDTGHDDDLNKAISKSKDLTYHAVVLTGPTKVIDKLTKGLGLYGKA